jgi:CubicO group peptidase (beta-lactamase class C family)
MEGSFDPAFRLLAHQFAASLEGGERGAVVVRIAGRTVVDLRGGRIDPQEAALWQADTLACVFSVTKGVISLLAHRLIDKGLLSPTATVASIWPAFAAQGKAEITVDDVLTHRAGLPAVSGPVVRGDLYDWDRMVDALAASAPVCPASTAPVYHNMTYGHLLGEILCRATGIRPLSLLLTNEVTLPLAADFKLGLGPADLARTARIAAADPAELFDALQSDPAGLFARSMAFFAEGEDFNSPRWRRAEIGSGSGHATALGVARLYDALIAPGFLSAERRADLAKQHAASDGPDPILGLPLRYGAGVELSLPPGIDFGPSARALGHWGAGGATGFADPEAGLAFGYVTGEMATGMGSSARARALVAALYDGL